MFGDVRALQELKNFDSQFIAGVKSVAPCTFIDKGELSEPAPYTPVPCAPRAAADGTAHARAADFNTKQMDVCPITPWTCPAGQLPYNVLPERGAVEDFAGDVGLVGGSFPGKCKVAPPLKNAKGPDADGVYSDA